MPSLKRILAGRANGARSKGPVTEAGKRFSSLNATRHGLLAKCVVLSNESPEGFHTLLAQHLERFDPLDDVELGVIEEMVAALWRLRRAWAVETRLHHIRQRALENLYILRSPAKPYPGGRGAARKTRHYQTNLATF